MRNNIRAYALLTALLAFALFPFGWLTKYSDFADRLIDTLFPNEAAHAVGHSLLFLAIGAALLAVFPALRRRPGRYFGLVLLVAVAQEGLQLLYKRRPVVINDITDIGVDLVAAGVMFALWYMWMRAAGRAAAEQRQDGRHAQATGRRG